MVARFRRLDTSRTASRRRHYRHERDNETQTSQWPPNQKGGTGKPELPMRSGQQPSPAAAGATMEKDDTPAAKTNDRAAPVRARSLDSTTRKPPCQPAWLISLLAMMAIAGICSLSEPPWLVFQATLAAGWPASDSCTTFDVSPFPSSSHSGGGRTKPLTNRSRPNPTSNASPAALPRSGCCISSKVTRRRIGPRPPGESCRPPVDRGPAGSPRPLTAPESWVPVLFAIACSGQQRWDDSSWVFPRLGGLYQIAGRNRIRHIEGDKPV